MRKQIGEQLRLQRCRLGRTMADAARETGLSLSTIRRLEDGRSTNLAYFERYAGFLGLEFRVSADASGNPEPQRLLEEVTGSAPAVSIPPSTPWIVRTQALRELLAASTVQAAGDSVLDIGGRLIAGELVLLCDEAVWVNSTAAKQLKTLIRQKLNELNRGEP